MLLGLLLAALVMPSTADATTPHAEPRSIQPLTPACADAPEGRFLDVSGAHQPGIDCLGWWGVAQGGDDQRFRPELPVRREQMASFLARTLDEAGAELPELAPVDFEDISGSTHARSIARLAEVGVVAGVSPTRFDPTGTVTRAQMASFLARAYEVIAGEPLAMGGVTFPDIDGNVHADNILRLAGAGLTGGLADGRYDPNGAVTRGQMGTFLGRLLALLVDEDHLDPAPAEPVPLPDPTQLMPPVPDRDPGTGQIHVPAVEPTILGSVDVEVAPGALQEIRRPVDPRIGEAHYWSFDGPAEAYRRDECTPVGVDGLRVRAELIAAGQQTESFQGHEREAGDCLSGTVWPSPWEHGDVADELLIAISNTGESTFRTRLHLGQRGRFSTPSHRAGTEAAYVFTAVSGDQRIRGLPPGHPLTHWELSVELNEPSALRVVTDPRIRPCDGAEVCFERFPGQMRLEDPVDAGFNPLDTSLVVRPGRCEYHGQTDRPGTLVGSVWHNERLIIEVEPAR